MSLPTFLQLSRASKRDISAFPSHRLAILGDCATQHLSTAIRGYAFNEEWGFDVLDADYNQIDALVLDPSSELYEFAPQTVLLYMCTESLYEFFCTTPVSQRPDFAEMIMERIRGYWVRIQQTIRTHILQFTFVVADDAVFGSYALKTPISFPFQLQKLNFLLMQASVEAGDVTLIDLNGIQSVVGRSTFHDERLYYIAKMPIAAEMLPRVAKNVVDAVSARCGRFKKCVVLDLDGTLWGGVIGDDGLDGIQVGELGLGHAFSDFQLWLKELRERGIILAVCSKNNEDIAKEPFECHPEMVLRLEDISVFVANWEDKATNICHIQQKLNIGMDSMVFLDDNPFERELVSSLIPNITVPQLPEDPALYLHFLRELNLFETASYSNEDRGRTEQYRAEAGRVELQQQLGSFDEYLQGLDMKAFAAPFDAFHTPRIAQLTQRSNQFNLRTIRYTDAEIEAVATDEQHITRYFTLHDRFGEHGLVSVVILDKQIEDTLFISEWLMSCRVLKRGMEEFIINAIMEVARQEGLLKVVGEYIPTAKNAMVAQIYKKLGFVDVGDGRFEANVATFETNTTYIKEEKTHE